MIELTFGDIKFDLRNEFSELTVKDLEVITSILIDENKDYFEKYLEILEYLKVPNEILDNIGSNKFIEIIKTMTFTKLEDVDKTFTRTVEINGYQYTAYQDKFSVSVRDLTLIEKAIKNNKYYISHILAIIFKRDDLTKKEHYDAAHLKEKSNLFKELPSTIAIPYLIEFSDKLIKKIKTLDEQPN